jgi:integrase
MAKRSSDGAGAKRRAAGEGSLRENKTTGLWEVRIELPSDLITGERRRKVVRRATHDAAVLELRRLQKDLATHGDLPSAVPTVADWLAVWYRDLDILKSKHRSRAVRRSHISQYLVPALGNVRLNRLGDEDLKRLLDLIVVKKGLTRSTARNVWTTLESALDAAVQMRTIHENRARTSVWRPKRSTPKVGSLSSDEAMKVLDTVSSDGDRLAVRWQMALLTGMRQGEALGIELDRIDLKKDQVDLSWQLQVITWSHGCERLQDGTWACGAKLGTACPSRFLDGDPELEIRHLTGCQYLVRPKTKRSYRILPLVGGLRESVESRLEAATAEPNPHGLLFTADPKRRWYAGTKTVVTLPLDGKPIDPSTDSKRWHALLERAQVHDVRLHDARRTTVSLLYELGIPEVVIQDIVGHVESRTTRIYRDGDTKAARDALTRLGGLLRY